MIYGDEPPLTLSADGANEWADHVHADPVPDAVHWLGHLALGVHGEAPRDEELGGRMRLSWRLDLGGHAAAAHDVLGEAELEFHLLLESEALMPQVQGSSAGELLAVERHVVLQRGLHGGQSAEGVGLLRAQDLV